MLLTTSALLVGSTGGFGRSSPVVMQLTSNVIYSSRFIFVCLIFAAITVNAFAAFDCARPANSAVLS